MKHIRILFLMLALSLSLLLFACTPTVTCPPHSDADDDCICDNCGEDLTPDTSGIKLTSIKFSGATYLYTGDERSISITGTLPEGVTVKYEGNGVKNAGTHTVKATFWYQEGGKEFYLEGKDLTATIKINKASYDLSGLTLPSYTVIADGNSHTPAILGNLPDGVEVYYTGGEQTLPGVYTVTANFRVDETNYIVPKGITTTLTILDGPRGLAGIAYVDSGILCDGEAKIPEISGTPTDGWSLSHVDGGELRYPGEYNVDLVFTNGADTYAMPISVTVYLDESSPTDGLIFSNASGGATVIGYTGTSPIVVIPAKHGVVSVTGIASGAFMNSDVTIVYLPDSVTNIGNNAFRGASSLEYIRLGNGLKTVGSAAFRDSGLTEISLPASLTAIGHGALEGTALEKLTIPFIGGSHNTSSPYLGYIFGADGYAGNATYVPESLKEVVLLDSCSEIAPYAFYKCTTLEKVVIGSGVTKIGVQAFAYTGIKEIFIPSTVTDIPAASDGSASPFYKAPADLVIKMEAKKDPSGFGPVWCVIDIVGSDDVYAEVVYGVSRE